ncbi:MAG: stationary phase survival protein SurE [Nautiliaceae bacterium]
MDYKNYLRDDIDIKILSNYPFYMAEVENDFDKFKSKLKDYDFGVWFEGDFKINRLKIFNSLKEKLSWDDIVLNYLNSLNTFLREQIGVCVEKALPRVIDNKLTYLIIQRKNYKDFDENFFIAIDGEVIFPMIKKEYDVNLALIKLAEWKNRAGIKNLIKFCD